MNNVLPLAETWDPAANVPAPTNALARYGSPENDVAPVVLFLASKDAQFITGTGLTADGGAIIERGRQGRDIPLNLSYRFNLAAQVQPGTYAWPLALNVRPL